jgi:hypothetical protein
MIDGNSPFMGSDKGGTNSKEIIEMLAEGTMSVSQFREVYNFMSDPKLIYQSLCEKHKPFMGVPIGAADAARKYSLRRPTITELVSTGYVRRIAASNGGGNYSQLIINHGDLLVYMDMRTIFNGDKPGPIKKWSGPFKQGAIDPNRPQAADVGR